MSSKPLLCRVQRRVDRPGDMRGQQSRQLCMHGCFPAVLSNGDVCVTQTALTRQVTWQAHLSAISITGHPPGQSTSDPQHKGTPPPTHPHPPEHMYAVTPTHTYDTCVVYPSRGWT